MHAPTALIIASFSTAAISVVFLLLWRATKGVDGPLHWFMGSGLLFVAGMLFFLRNLYPSDFTIVLANAVLTSGYLVLLWGVAKFVSQSLPWRIVGIAVALYAAAFAYFLWIEPGFVGRAVTSSVLHALCYFAMAYYLFRYRGEKRWGAQFWAGVFFTLAGAIMFATLSYAVVDVGTGPFIDLPAVKFRIISSPVLSLAWGLSLVVATMQRLVDAERTAKEDVVRLNQALEQANHAKSEFLANMSHELRSPLNAVLGYADTIRQRVFGPLGNQKYEEYVEHIHQSGTHLLGLINDILDITSIEAGALKLNENVENIKDLILDSIELLRPVAAEKQITMDHNVSDELPSVRVDRLRIKQIFINLLSNAIKFTEPGGRVMMDATEQSDGSMTIRISDNGIGMTEEEIEIALTQFGQINKSALNAHEGTGLGLPISNQLIELHGGELSIQSAQGEGTTVSITLRSERVLSD
jgi:signal transduction histidine kinase